MAMNYDNCERPTSRVSRPPGGTSSNIFGTDPIPAAQPPKQNASRNYQSNIFGNDDAYKAPKKANKERRDPITGELIGNGDERAVKEEEEEKKVEVVEKKVDPAPKINDGEPRLGAVKNSSGLRCNQPPGGRSSFTLG